jgi:TatA/E family protein of Tat protein translocase
MPQIGPLEIAMVLLVALVVFGPTKLPELGKQAARGLREFRQFQSGLRSDLAGMLDSSEHDDDDGDDPDHQDPDDPDVSTHELETGAGGEVASPDPPAAPEASSGEGPPADASQ